VVGLDVAAHVSEILAQELGRAPPDLTWLKEKLAAGQLGKKSGEGFYVWKDGKPQKAPNSDSGPTAGQKAEQAGARLPLPPPDLTDRLMLLLANECVALLREGVAEDADLIDAAVIFGTGFAPFRGGPLRFASDRGIPAVVSRLIELEMRYGERFRPDPGWRLLGVMGEVPRSATAAAAVPAPH